jgi:hypothetical protein
MSKLLFEGGNVWSDTVGFDHMYIPAILQAINGALTGTGIRVLPVGSGATPTPGKISGDMDVIVDEATVLDFFGVQDAKTARKSLAQYLNNKGFEVSQSGINVHVKVPVGDAFHQVDVMVTPNARKVALFHTHAIPQGSPYKGVNKQLIMAMIAKERGLMWSAWQGLFSRDAKGKKNTLITDDLNKVAQLLLGADKTSKDLGSVETILASLPQASAQALLNRAKDDPNWAVVKEKKMNPRIKEGVVTKHKEWYVLINEGATETALMVQAYTPQEAHKKSVAWAQNHNMPNVKVTVSGEYPTDATLQEAKKQRLDPTCWKGFRKEGTKVKGDTVVNNCVPVDESEMLEETLLGNSFHEKYGWIRLEESSLMEAVYQGRKVTLNKPTRGDVAKFKVFVKDPSTGNIKKVNFGDKNMTIKKHIPGRRKSFRARHKCDTAKDKTTARYWSCRAW